MISDKRLFSILYILVISSCLAYTQSEQDLRTIYNSLLPDFQQLTPEASALGQYGKYTASAYTGVPAISIPLFSIGSGDFTMPVELCYDASGIKVEQQATYVGLGWNLILGGSITQTVCGQFDFGETSYSSLSNQNLHQSICPNMPTNVPYAGIVSVSFPAVPTTGVCMPIESDREKFNLLRNVSIGARVPDIFQASFCGHNVSFVLDEYRRNAKIISNDATNYKIEVIGNGYVPSTIEITDDYGITYIFGLNRMYDDRVSYSLSKIKNEANRILAVFKYFEGGYNLLQSYYETIGKNDESYNKPIASEALRRQFIEQNYPNTLGHGMIEYYPDTIVTDKEIVIFSYGDRDDIKGAKRIDSITVKANDESESIIHRVSFGYGNFIEVDSNSTLCNRYGYSSVYEFSRMKLIDVTVDDKKYSMKYNERVPLPPRLSVQQDFWGYYNAQSNRDGFCATPEFRYNENGKLVGLDPIGPANRYASEENCKIGILNRITYPTGGYTEFDYEINHFDDEYGKYYYPTVSSVSPSSNAVRYEKTVSCGSRFTGTGYKTTPDTTEFDVEQPTRVVITSNSPYYPSTEQYYKLSLGIIGTDSIGNTIFARHYTKYNDKQDINESYELPKGHYVLSSQFDIVTRGLIVGGSIRVTFPTEYREDLSFADVSGKSVGGGLRIKTIKNYDNGNVHLGTTRYKYKEGKLLIPTVKKETIYMQYLYAVSCANPSVYVIPTTLDCQFFFVTSHSTYPAVCSLGSPTIGYSEVTIEHYDNNGELLSYDVEKYHNNGYVEYGDPLYFNLFRVNMNGLNGKMTESARYSAEGELMQKTNYTYTFIGSDASIDDIVFFPWTRCLNQSPGGSSLDVLYKYSLYPKFPVSALPCTMVETSYVDNHPMKPITTTYRYNENNYQPIEVVRSFMTEDHTTDTTTTRYWYPDDPEVTNCNTSCLTLKHNISERVQAKAYHNGNEIGGYRNNYGFWTDSLPVIIENYSINANGIERRELEISDYDNHGNVREYLKKDGIPVAIIWSYNHQCPIMEIVGCTYAQVLDAFPGLLTLENGYPLISNATDPIKRAYDTLRAALPLAHITAFEYSPWLTVSKIIKPNGYVVKYDYDQYGRLIASSDGSGIIQRFYYNFEIKK